MDLNVDLTIQPGIRRMAHKNPLIVEPAGPVKLRVKNVSAWYGVHEAVKSVTMEIPERRVTAIIGPSGCGKSTFIRCLNRMHEVIPQARAQGQVLLNGEDLYGPRVDPVQVR